METKILNYRIIITSEKMKGKTVYNAVSPTLGVADWGHTVQQALTHIKGAIECYLESLVKNHEPIPVEEESDFVIGMASVSLPEKFRPTFV